MTEMVRLEDSDGLIDAGFLMKAQEVVSQSVCSVLEEKQAQVALRSPAAVLKTPNTARTPRYRDEGSK